MRRRQILQAGALGIGAIGLGSLGYQFFPPSPSSRIGATKDIAIQLFQSLTPTQQARLVVDYDHPLRQYHNRGVWTGGELVATAGFSRSQLSLAADLFHSGLSSRGRSIIPSQFFQRLPGVMVHNLLFCGDPSEAQSQVLFTGPHLNLRVGGKSVEGVAFGGPQIYGDQHGNEEPGLPGNVYQYQLNLGTKLFQSLSPGQQAEVVLAQSPIQTQIEIQGLNGRFPGIPVSELSQESKSQVTDLINGILAPYPTLDADYAMECLLANGGTEALYLSYYADSDYDNEIYQTFRLEGPASVFYFRGFPHLHAFFNIAMDPDNPLSVGETVGTSTQFIEGENLKALLEASMTTATEADFAYYNLDSVVGKIRPGTIRTGDLYNAESWQSDLTLVSVKGSNFSESFRKSVGAETIDSDRTYTIATSDYIAEERLEQAIGQGKVVGTAGLIRDALIDHVRHHGVSTG